MLYNKSMPTRIGSNKLGKFFYPALATPPKNDAVHFPPKVRSITVKVMIKMEDKK